MSTKNLVAGALLTALALVIPISFGGYLRIYIPPFSATLASHVPVMLAFLINPLVAVMVGLGSATGFLVMMGPVVAARAFIHVIFGYIGAKLVQQGTSIEMALLITAPVHALGESLVVLPFGFTLYKAFVLVGAGTFLHHLIDSAIAVFLARTVLAGAISRVRN
ncbi:ECF transporter S component [Thermosediminibacter litoriperuensis]|uniref:Niacin transporter n=1 Tax=Thermosediminibacter litoriperuensis TaxID=291989 RepID=A0A5S5AZZ0_9FIRM|nr:ECF transporter S component [Thermosediminibacter litoriperuensis]TYP58825.1 niacin transporter [Thermosediminibacter litoriperuensis]